MHTAYRAVVRHEPEGLSAHGLWETGICVHFLPHPGVFHSTGKPRPLLGLLSHLLGGAV